MVVSLLAEHNARSLSSDFLASNSFICRMTSFIILIHSSSKSTINQHLAQLIMVPTHLYLVASLMFHRFLELPRMPKIYFQVASQDGWGRHRTEGYTYLDIPSQPGESNRLTEQHGEIKSSSLGYYDEHLSCWRPRGDSIFNELRRFFIGGSHELEDISYVAIPKQFQGEKVMKQPLTPLSCKTNRCQSSRRKHRSVGLVFEQWRQEHYTYGWTSFFNPSKPSSRSIALKWSDARRSSRTLSMESEKRRGAYALNRYGYVFETGRISRWIFIGFISTDSTLSWPILMLLSVRILIDWLVRESRSFDTERLCLDAFQHAKKRAVEVRESTLQLLSPKTGPSEWVRPSSSTDAELR